MDMKNNIIDIWFIKVAIFILIFFFWLSSVFAETQIILKSSDTQINIDESLNIELQIILDWELKGWNIAILWLNEFKQLGTKNGSSYSNINWKISNMQTITISLAPYSTGSFIVWPAVIWSGTGEIKSNTIEVEVLDIKKEESSIIWKSNEEDNWSLDEKEEENIKNEWIIYDYHILWKFNYYFIFIIFLLIIISLYFVDKYNNKPKKIVKKEIVFDLNLEKEKLIKKLDKLKKNHEKYQKPEFYSKLNIIFRQYFKLLWIKDSETLTLKEIKSLKLDNKLVNLFEKSYLKEFNEQIDIIDERDDLIDDLIWILK